jgi:hypothetical protein
MGSREAQLDPADVDDDAGDPALRATLADARPAIDDVVRAVIRANAARALFAASSPVTVGRYRLEREIGTGGGGAVFVARDPELDRAIALKLVAAPDAALRARAVAEGQALARLSHPNVVPVFDVGVADGRVYLVMELVAGESLRAYAANASLREVVRAYRQAGDGLAAAHAAGLVHRDFKPDNAVVGRDGRVRVIDFGLASASAATPASRAGTPGYMAPEQRAGTAATAASDQYAFGVALREGATRAAGALPRWLEPIVRRATAEDPAARYPAMPGLLRALADDPRTRWRRRALIATPIALAIAGFVLGSRGDAATPCDGAAALAPVATPERIARAEGHVAGLGTPFAALAAPRVRAAVDAYAGRWIAAHDAACVAARSEPSRTLVDRRAACLARARTQLDATIDLVAHIGPDDLPRAVSAVSELPEVDACADSAALLADTTVPPTPAQATEAAAIATALDRAQAAIVAASPAAATDLEPVVARARALGYRPALAAALLAHGKALLALDQRDAALAPLEEAYALAFATGAHAIAVEAFARAAWLRTMRPGEPGAALAGLDVVAAIADGLGARDRFAQALLHNNAGVVHNAAGRPDLARARFTTALALAREVTGPGAVELIAVRRNLARVTSDPAERARLFAEAATTAAERLGADHPTALDARIGEAFALEDDAAARAALRAPCTRLAALHASHRTSAAECGTELAWLDLASGDAEQARASLALVLAAEGAPDFDPERIALARAYAALLDGDHAAARSQLAAIAARVQPGPGAVWWQHLFAGEVELGRVLAARAAGARDEVRAARDRAIGYLERAAAKHALPVIGRRLAWARAITG